ncbi:MAG: hypothetical protein IPM54_13335 [Polyangiaceae bacterium]|nr:hypothetical protein [Polyangiaceae bacterium]
MSRDTITNQPIRSFPSHRTLRFQGAPIDARAIRHRPPRAVTSEEGEVLTLLTRTLRELMQQSDLEAGDILLRCDQYEASALGEYVPEVGCDPIAITLRACATRKGRSDPHWQTAVRAAVRAASASSDTIDLGGLARTCDALRVTLIRNEHVDTADRHTLSRAQELGLLSGAAGLARYRASRFSELTATAYPNASADVLQIANDWHYWLWSFDDRTDVRGGDLATDLARHERVVSSLLELLAGRDVSTTAEATDPNVRFLALILAELQAVAPAGCVDRFRGAVREYLLRGSLPGARNWATDHTPDPETFLAQRIHEGAYNTVLPFIELAVGSATEDDVVTSAEARRAALLSNLIVVVSNDIFSYEKEVQQEGNPNNLLHAVMTHEHRSLRGGYLRAVALVEEWTGELLAIDARAEGALRRYIRGSYTWIVASYHWHFLTGRYASKTSPFTELRRS